MLDAIAVPFEIKGHRLHVSASIGITCYPQDDSDTDALLRHADQAMYQAKDSGKNAFQMYAPVKHFQVMEKEKALDEFKVALREDQLLLHFQPRVDLQTGEFSGAEALVRWDHPEKGVLLPAHFLPQIEGTPLEIELDEWVLKRALDQHTQWREQGLNIAVSVNITPRHIQQESFPEYLENLLEQYPEDIAKYLELEILETSAIGNVSTVTDVMNKCAALGVQFSLDDFGTGYSSLAYFRSLPIQILKIDRDFVRRMLKSHEDQQIVEGVIQLANSIDRPVVAEGVENKELAFMLHQLGCRYAQGIGISKPVVADEIVPWSIRWKKEGFWLRREERSASLTSCYDLNVAIFTTQKWLSDVRRYLTGYDKAHASLFDETSSQFSQWYHGIGTSNYGKNPNFPFILAKHNAAYVLAQELRDKSAAGPVPERDILDLEHLTHEVIDMLKTLGQE